MIKTTTRQYMSRWELHRERAGMYREMAESFRWTSVGDAEDREVSYRMATAMAEREDFLAREAIIAAGGAV